MPRLHIDATPIRPDRLRRIGSDGFAFLPNAFLQNGFFASLDAFERSLYMLLVLVADRQGMSYYGHQRLGALLQLPIDDLLQVRNRLIAKDLIAFDGTRFQVLSLPDRPVAPPTRPLAHDQDFERDDPATIRRLLQRSLRPPPR